MRRYPQDALFRTVVLMGAALTACGGRLGEKSSAEGGPGQPADAESRNPSRDPGDAPAASADPGPDAYEIVDAASADPTAIGAEGTDDGQSQTTPDAAAVNDGSDEDACPELATCCVRDPAYHTFCCTLPHYGCIK